MGQNNLSSDRNIYVKQIIEMSEESKKTLTISSDIILDETITDLNERRVCIFNLVLYMVNLIWVTIN